MVVVVGGARLRWWCLVVLSCGDMGGGVGVGSVSLAVGVISCRDYELKRESQGKREREGREKILKKYMHCYCSSCVYLHTFFKD